MGKRSAYYTTVPAQEGEKKEKSVQTMGERWRLLCSEGLGNRHIQEARASVGGQTSTQTSRGVSRDGGEGGGPALCNRLTPCFCWHGCLRVPGSTQTEESGCPTTTHRWVWRCRLWRTVSGYVFSSRRARAHAFCRPATRAHASCM